MADSMETPWEARNKTTIWPSNHTPRHIPWGNQNWKWHINRNFTAALFKIARTWMQPRRPTTEEWIKKRWCIYTMEYYSAIRRNTFESVLMRCMKLEPIIQSEVSQKEKYKYHTLTHIYIYMKSGEMVLVKLFSGKQQRSRHTEQTYGQGGRREGRRGDLWRE